MSSQYNWALQRCILGEQTLKWGSDDTADLMSSVSYSLSGKNVDVIIVDGHIDPDHPEFAKNSDGTGGSRVNQFNWFSLNSIVSSIDDDGQSLLTSNYVYTPYTSGYGSSATADNNHGSHVAGTVAGNTNGWARDATIYNISPYSTNPNTSLNSLALWDYIRAFHRSKPINPETGYKNPTICNCSYGSTVTFPSVALGTGSVTRVTYRGVTTGDGSSALSAAQLTNNKIYNTSGTVKIPYYYQSMVADIQQALDDGIIIVGSAGNDSFFVDTQLGLDYNNTFRATYGGVTYDWYCHRGSVPGSASSVITVGSVGPTAVEKKSTFSNTGPGVDIFAPGHYIMSSYNTRDLDPYTDDTRNATYPKGKMNGTSMSSPQVCGVLACALEMYPHMTQSDAREYLLHHAKLNQLTDTGGGTADTTALQSAPNRYLYAPQERKTTNYVFPKFNFKIRPTLGQAYPRVNRRKYK